MVNLSQAIDWDEFEGAFGRQMSPEGGRPSLPTRLLVGLHYLKALYDESDESSRCQMGRKSLLAILLWRGNISA
ncbi:MAG: hypothetical protein F6K42_37565 [Leptolyngbya sp. SIO1D8]|nr:hypothetical protein [Leptolyngbya sp. SIO1D8]